MADTLASQNTYINMSAVNSVNTSDRATKNSFLKLPENTRVWLWFEQTHNPNLYDKDYFPSPKNDSLKQVYLPGSRNVFQLAAYRVPVELLSGTFIKDNKFIETFREDQNHYTLLVHPSLRNDYMMSQLGCSVSNRVFYFMPAASARTGLTWELGKEYEPFFSKMSVYSGQNQSSQPMTMQRTDLQQEGRISVAKTSAIKSAGISYLDCFFQDQCEFHLNDSLRGTTGSSFGVLFRQIPRDITAGHSLYIPFFSLASTPVDHSKPLLIQLMENAGLNFKSFFSEKLFKPVIDFIMKNSMSGLYAEHLHGQNLLIKLNTTGTETIDPLVMYRDTADMKVDSKAETKMLTDTRMADRAPSTSMTPGGYIYLASVDFIRRSITPIFMAISSWHKKGDIVFTEKFNPNLLVHMFFSRLFDEIKSKICHEDIIHSDYFYNSLCEFLSYAQMEGNILKNTPREREWHNLITKLASSVLSSLKDTCVIDQHRQVMLKTHLNEHIQELMSKFQHLDLMNTNSGSAMMTMMPGHMPGMNPRMMPAMQASQMGQVSGVNPAMVPVMQVSQSGQLPGINSMLMPAMQAWQMRQMSGMNPTMISPIQQGQVMGTNPMPMQTMQFGQISGMMDMSNQVASVHMTSPGMRM